ncbi:MAG: PAS domain S-box protein [Bacteroidetes bacterium]|nr:PAS domain S-box protein [Bacteroidota bacterium]
MSGPYTLLLVDDSMEDAELAILEIKKVLPDCIIYLAETKETFFTQIETVTPDLILTDYQMNGFNGMDVIKYSREKLPLTPVILWTGALNEEVAVDCIKLGATNYVLKDNIKRLAPAILKATEERAYLAERNEARHALELSEHRFSVVFNSNPAPMMLTRLEDGTILDCNEAFERLFDYQKSSVIGKTTQDLQFWQNFEDRNESIKLIKDTGEIKERELILKTRTGQEKIILLSMVPVEINKEICLITSLMDISDIRKSEENIKNSEERVRLIADNITDIFWMADFEAKKFLYISPGFESVYGIPVHDVLEDPNCLFNAILPHDREIFLSRLEAHNPTTNFTNYFRIQRPDGTIRTLWNRGFPIRNTSQKGTFLAGISQDVTDSKSARETLLVQSAALQSAANAILIADRDGEVSFLNHAFLKLTGSAQDNFLPFPEILFSQGYSTKRWNSEIKPQLESGNIWSGVIEETRIDGSPFTAELTITPIRQTDNEITHFIAILQDITERKNIQSRIEHLQKMESIGILASGMAHDFNNILSIILTNTGALQRLAPLHPEMIEKTAETISDAVKRGSGLVRQILTFARKSGSEFGPMNVSLLLSDTLELLQGTLPKSITLTREIGDLLPLINTDPNQFGQIILNICVNAKNAMPNGGNLTIRSEVISSEDLKVPQLETIAKQFVSISISDTGIGMDSATLQHIFDPFFTTRELGEGSGLGLSVVYGIMKSHDGFIHVESKVGKGSDFYLYFPVPDDNSSPVSENAPEDVSGFEGSAILLLVEDEKPMLNLVKMFLESYGYNILTATDGQEGLAVYAKHSQQIDLVISDIGLPKLEGDAMFFEMKKINPEVKLVFASGLVEPELKRNLLAEGVIEIIGKPYDVEYLLKRAFELTTTNLDK